MFLPRRMTRFTPILPQNRAMGKPRSYSAVSIAASFALLITFLLLHRHTPSSITISSSDQSTTVDLPTEHREVVDTEHSEVVDTEHREVVPTEQRDVAPTSYTCKSNTTAAFDSAGQPCFTDDRLANQLIYATKKDGLSYLYCSIPKNGCTYHLGIMHRIRGHSYEGGPTVHNSDNKERLAVTTETLREMLADPTVHKYMVVRNPLERVLSAYLDKVERELPSEEHTQASFEKWVYKEITPDMNNSINTDAHWRPQLSYCGFSVRDLWTKFKWFTVEEPEPYVDYLEQLVPEWVTKDGWNGKDNTSFREAVLGPRKRTGHTSERFFEYVTSVKLFDYLEKAYAKDIDTLGYRADIDDMRKEVVKRSTVAKEPSP